MAEPNECISTCLNIQLRYDPYRVAGVGGFHCFINMQFRTNHFPIHFLKSLTLSRLTNASLSTDGRNCKMSRLPK